METVRGNKSHWHWLRTRSDFSDTEPSSILHCNVFVPAYIIMNYSILTSCNTVLWNVVQTAAYIILSRLHCNAQIEAAYIIFLLSRRWASTHLALSHRQLVHLFTWVCHIRDLGSPSHQCRSGPANMGNGEPAQIGLIGTCGNIGLQIFRLTGWCQW